MNRKKRNPDGVPEEKKKKSASAGGKHLNREMALVTYLFMALFLVMAGYMIWFVMHDTDQILNNPGNKRQELLAKRVTRGRILSSEGE